jgi:hypothetical protein
VTKNNSTSRYFKFVTRIIKRLRYEMSDAGIPVANGISSYLIECMVYNVPNEGFRQTDYTGDVRYVLAHIYHAIKSAASCEEWVEVNGMKWLFRGQDLKRQAAFAWVSAAWDYVGFD